ncbi:MAG TPA: hypothetical protein VF818_02015 [Ktedonobacterales bacterium]|jgi:acyl dehydratase
MTTGIINQVGATVTLTKAISEADVALVALLTNDHVPTPDKPMSLDPMGRVQAPSAFLTMLLIGAASRHVGGSGTATVVHGDVSYTGAAWIGDTVTTSAEVLAHDAASQTVRVRAQCVNQDGKPLAAGTFDLRASA